MTEGWRSSTIEPEPLEMTGASSVPTIVTATVEGVPSAAATLKVSESVWPAARPCTAGSALFSA